MSLLVLLPFYFIIPMSAIALCMRSPLVNKLGPVIVCYVLNISLGLGLESFR